MKELMHRIKINVQNHLIGKMLQKFAQRYCDIKYIVNLIWLNMNEWLPDA